MNERTIQCAARLSEEENRLVEEYSEKMHVSKASFIRYALFNVISGMEKEKGGFLYD